MKMRETERQASKLPEHNNDNKRYEVDLPEIQEILTALADSINEKLPEGWGFNLLLFNFGPDGLMFYISNAQRETMIKAMEEFLQKAQ